MLKRKLLKRALPLLLSVSMVFGSMPTTAFAAEYEDSVAVEESALDESEAVDENAESSNDAPVSTVGEASEEVEEGESSETESVQETGTAKAENDNKAETEVTTQVETEQTAGNAEEVTDVAEVNADAALVTEITTKNVKNYVNSNLTYLDDVVIGTYTGTGIFDNFVNDTIKNNSNNAIEVKVDGQSKENLKSNLVYKWKKADAEGNYTVDLAAGETPTDAGAYRLEISLDAVANVCSAAAAGIDFRIEQAELKLADLPKSVKIGETLTSFVDSVKENYTLNNRNEILNKDVFVKSFDVTLVDAVTGTNLTYDANTVFEKNKDYAYTVSVELNDANYKLAETEMIVISLTGDIETSMEITLPKLIEYQYTGEKVALPVAGTDYTVKVIYQAEDEDGKLTDTEIANPAITAEWADADGIKMGEEEAPVNAGSYKLVLTFTDTTGRYAECEESIDVKVTPVSVYVKPSLTVTEYASGMSESDILKNVEYEVLKTADNQAVADFSKDTFWGVSYHNELKTQPYELVFTLEAAKLMLDAEGKPVKDADGTVRYSDYTNNNGEALIAGSVDGNLKAKYRVVFSGKKAVYYANGTANLTDVNDHGTNGADTNHKVDLSADTLSKYAADVTVTEAALVTINTDAYANDAKTKIFDGKPFYEKRADYKKATAGENGTLTYKWYQAQKVVTTDAQGNETVEYKLGTEVLFDKNDTDIDGNQYIGVSPYAVGTYMLVISYHDASGATVAAKPAQVGPYVIEKQKVQAEIGLSEGAALVSYTGVSIREFTDDYLDSVLNVVKPITNNVLDPIALGEVLAWEEGLDYEISYVVERQNNLTGEWTEAVEGAFEEDCKYRLRAKVVIDDELLDKYYQSYELDKDNKRQYYLSNALDIEVKKMGTAEISISVDESKITNKIKKYDAQSFDIPKNAISVVTVKDGQPVENIALVYQWDCSEYDEYGLDEAVNVGEYTLQVRFLGDENYKPYDGEVSITGYEITPRSITVQPVVKENITAGTAAVYRNVVDGYMILADSDILESERPFFEGIYDEETGLNLAAINSVTGVIYESDAKTAVLNNVLKGDKTYYAVATRVNYNSILNKVFAFSRNYEAKFEKTEFKPVRGNAIVTGYNTSVKDYVDGMTHTIAAKEGVPYSYNLVQDEDGKTISGNFLIYNVKAPREYYENGNRDDGFVASAFEGFVYKNSLKEAGGYVVEEDKATGVLRVAIPITKEDVTNNVQKSFQVRWENGYVETFTVNCTGVVLEDDLSKAVAPKSLGFNSPVTKMIVGEKQQLDVKVVKVNLDDVICLKYETKDTAVLSVSDTGAVVALSKGAGAVEAIPCYLDENGEKQPIEGAKRATVKISVADVTAPKIKSVKAYDRSAIVTYPAVADGYRREIYVLEGKNLKDTAFKDKIPAIKNGDWKSAGFATRPVYNTEASTAKGAMTDVWVTGLEPGKEYTVYVRNVSGIRTLADGTTVVASEAGSAKGFLMSLPQVCELGIGFDKEKYYKYNELLDEYIYMVPLSEKSVSAITTGWFEEIFTDSTVNTPDWKEYVLPLDKETAQTYAQPTLNYYVSKSYNGEDVDISDLGPTWSAATDIAKIDKKGKLTLTGVGLVHVLVVDTQTQEYAIVPFIITATADRMEIAKSAKLKVGQKVNLYDLMTYYEGKTKLTGYIDYSYLMEEIGMGKAADIRYGVEGDKDSFIIVNMGSGIDDFLRRDYAGEVTAAKPNGTITIGVRDVSLGAESAVSAITITSSAIDPVKGLKATTITDKYATISFTYPLLDTDWEWLNTTETESSNQVYFRIQVKDASKRIVSDRYFNMFDDFYHIYDAKKNLMTLTTTLGGFTRKSSYTVSVTACYLDQISKEVSKGIKTTDIPAAYPYEHGGDFYEFSKLPGSEYMTTDGGIDVSVGNSTYLSGYPTLTSNNTYTLIAEPENSEAKNRQSDTLTWKSTNTKVASVKANAGTYTATLKTLRKGTTKIEVSSKLTKRIIARWTVIVNAVGEASYYFGDLEPDEGNPNESGIEYGEEQLLSIDNPVKATLMSGEGMRAKFVAPAYGRYTFTSDSSMLVFDADGRRKNDIGYTYAQEMKQGETLYFRVYQLSDATRTTVSLRADGTIYQSMDMSGITLKEAGSVVFTAPEDNYYSVYQNGNDTAVRELGGMKQGETKVISLMAGTYTVGKRTVTDTVTINGLKEIAVPAKTTNWYVFTAPTDMEYTFGISSDALDLRFYDDITSGQFDSRTKRALEKDEKLYIAVVNSTEEEIKADLTVTAAAEPIAASGESTITLEEAGKEAWVQLKIEDAGLYHVKITAAAEGDTAPSLTVRRANSTSSSGYTIPLEDDYTFDKGDIVYFSLSSDTAKTTVTVNVSKITGAADSIGEESTEAAINAGGYEFTAKTAGTYVFSAEEIKVSDDKTVPVYVKVYDEDGNVLLDTLNLGRAVSTGSLELSAGQKVYVRYYTLETVAETKTAIKIAKLSAEVFTDTWKGTLKAGETRWLQFKAPADARYMFATEIKQMTEAGNGTVSGFVPESEYYKQGNGFDVRLTANDADVEYTITVTLLNPEVLANAEIELGAGESKWFKYTAFETGRYKAALTGADITDVTVRQYDNLEDMNNLGFAAEFSLDAGKTIYYEVKNSGDAAKKVTFAVTQITAEAMTLENNKKEKELANGESVWYSFKASRPGYYQITAEASAQEGVFANASVDYYANLNNGYIDYNSTLNVVYLAANDSVYAEVTCSTGAEKTKVTTTLTAMNPTDITPAATPVEKKDEKIAEAGKANWYSISGEGTYTVSMSDATSSSYSVYYAKNGNARFSAVYGSLDLTLGSEDTYTIVVYARVADLGYTLTAAKRDVKALTLAQSVSAELKQGEDLYVSFKLPETGRYAVMLDGLTEGVTADFEELSGKAEYQGYTNTYYTFYNKVNETLIFKVGNVSSETAVTLTLSASAVTPETVTDVTESGKATIDINSVKEGHFSWYSYTAPETGVYMVKASEGVSMVACNSLGAADLRDVQPAETYLLDKDETVYWAVWYDQKPSANIELRFGTLETHTIAAGGTLQVDTKDVTPGERYRVVFTAPEDGIYTFTCSEETETEGETPAGKLVEMYRCEQENAPGTNDWISANNMLQKDQKFIFDAVYTHTALKSYTISAVKQEIKPVAAEGTELTLKAGEYQYVSITPGTSCNVTINVEAADGIYYTTAKTSIDYSLLGDNFFRYSGLSSMEVIATVSSAAYIGFRADQDGTVKISYTEAEPIETLGLGENVLTVERDMIFSFTAEETGLYSFRGAEKGSIQVEVGNTSSGALAYITSGGAALVKLSYNGNTMRTITVVKEDVTPMSLGTARTLDVSDGTAYMEITAEKEGMYVISSQTRSYAGAYKLNERSSGGTWVEDSPIVNPMGALRLTAGKYIIEVSTENETNTAEYTISYYGKGLYLEDESVTEHITANSNEVVYVKVYAGYVLQFDVIADKNVRVEYLPSLDKEAIFVGEGTSVSTQRFVPDSESTVPYLKITARQDNTDIGVSFRYIEEAKSTILHRGENYVYADIEDSDYVGYVDYIYSCETAGNHKFEFFYEDQRGISKMEIYSAKDMSTLLKTIDYSQCGAETYDMTYGTDYVIRIYTNESEAMLNISAMAIVDNINHTPYEYFVSRDMQKVRFVFTAPESGAYVFCSASTEDYSDTEAYLYDTLGNMLKYDDESGGRNNFSIVYEMNSGETVWLETSLYGGGYEYGSYYVHIDRYNGDIAEESSASLTKKAKAQKTK